LKPTYISSCESTKVYGRYGFVGGLLRRPSYTRNGLTREALSTKTDSVSRLMDTT